MTKATLIAYPAVFILSAGVSYLIGDSIPVALAMASATTLGTFMYVRMGRQAG